MAETISPVVHGGNRRRYWSTLAVHATAAATTGALIGAGLGLVGGLLQWPARSAAIALAFIAGALAVRDLFTVPIPLPALRRQVPEWWRTFFKPHVAAGLYGAGLGVGFLTHLYTGSLVVVAVGAFVSGKASVGALLYGTYGLVRAASLLVVSTARDEWALEVVIARLEVGASRPAWRRASGALLGVTAALAAIAV